VAGSGEERQVGLGLLVPAILLALVVTMLVAGQISLIPAAPEGPVAVVDEPSMAELLINPDPDDSLVEVVNVATPEPTMRPAIMAAIATPAPTKIPTPAPTATPTWAGPPTFTFVALGVDQRDDREIPRTDTIMIGQVDLRGPRVSLVSIPRDLLVDIPGYGKDRINSAYVYGEQFREPGGGIGLLQRTIDKSFGIKIDHFGLVDFQCFRTAIDSVGGVTINVPRAIVDPKYPTEDYGTKLVEFEPGIQVMDGERALEYSRTRSADNDFQRIQRQQLVVAAMREQFLQLRALPAIPTLLSGCRNMRSDLGWREYLTLATAMRTMDSKSVSFAAINENMVVDSILPSGAAVLLPRWDTIRPMLGERFGAAGTVPGLNPSVSGSPVPAVPGASPSPLPFGSPAPFGTPAPLSSPRPFSPTPDGSVADSPMDVLPGDALTPVVLVPQRT
jgi:LCP family protein required for cell wall assembly